MSNFTDSFKPLKFQNLGLVRFPNVEISKEDRVRFGLKDNMTNRAILGALAWAGYQKLRAKGQFEGIGEDQVKQQFRTEFETFDKTGVHDYLLLVWDYNRWADEQGIVRGWGRGSAASSLTLYCLGVTRVNPMRHKLNFPRFISEARLKPVIKDGITYVDGKSAPDVDCDYQYGRRAEVINYIETKYKGRTCKISTRLELTGKTALKNVLKIYGAHNDEEAQRVSDLIEAKFGKVQSLCEARESNAAIKKWIEASKTNEEIFSIAQQLEGCPLGKGQHPSGVFIGYDPLEDTVPIELAKEKKGEAAVVTSYDMETVAGLGVKADILGVRTLDLVAETAKIANVELDSISVDDSSIYEFLNRQEANYVGLFQIEDGTTKDAVVKVGPKNIDALSACLAISRPGALKYLDQYASYSRTGTLKSIYPAIDKVLGFTGNVLIYQEQITAICHEVFGLSQIDADQVRYAVGKKKKEEMAKWEPVLTEMGTKRGIPPDVIKYFWDVCNASADYLFVFSHSISYSYLTASTTYLKSKYPQAYYLTMLRLAKEEPNATDYMNTVIGEMTRVGIALLPPDLFRSEMDFSIDNGSIRFGLSSIKGISEMTFSKLEHLRGKTFPSKFDLFDAAKGASIQINMLTSLIACGALVWPDTPRSLFILEAQTYNLLSDGQKIKVKNYSKVKNSQSIIDLLRALPEAKNEKGKPLISEKEMARIRRDHADYWHMYQSNIKNEQLSAYIMEKTLLGFSYTTTLHKVYSSKVEGLITLSQMKERGREFAALVKASESDGERKKSDHVKAVCFIEEAKNGVSKSNGSPYCKMLLSDDTGTFMCMLYGEDRMEACQSFNGRAPEEGDIVIVQGGFSKEGGLLFADTVIIQSNPVRLKRADGKEDVVKEV